MYGTVQQIKDLTGVKPASLGQNPNLTDSQLEEILTSWLEHISAEIDIRIGGPVTPADSRYKGIEAVCIRTVSKLVGYAVQNRTARVVQVGEFAIRVLNASDVIRDLDWELRPYVKRQISLFHSAEEWVDPDAGV